MKKITLLPLLLIVLFSCSKDVIKGSGNIISEERVLPVFQSVNVKSNTGVFIMPGASFRIIVKTSDNLLHLLKTEVSNAVLNIYYEEGDQIRNDHSQIFITMPSIASLAITGDAVITAAGTYSSVPLLQLSVTGHGNINADTITAAKALIQITGNGNVFAKKLMPQIADIFITGNGNIDYIESAASINVTITGNGKVYYNGNPQLHTNISGQGKIIKK